MDRDSILSLESLEILRNGRPIARLNRLPEGVSLRFTDLDVARSLLPPGVAFCLPPNEDEQKWTGESLPPFFANLLPEGRRLASLVNQLRTSQDDLFSLLALSHAEVIGDIQIHGSKATLTSALPPWEGKDWTWREIRAKYDAEKNVDYAGVMSKISGYRLTVMPSSFRSWPMTIVKFPDDQFPLLAENEAIVMASLKRAKIRGAQVKTLTDRDGVSGLLVRRFDRQRKDAPALHQEDALQVMDLYPQSKYVVTWRQLTEELARRCSSPIATKVELITWYAYAYLVGNADLHAKNVSLHTDPATGVTMLTPAYDWLTTFVYEQSQDATMALKMGHKTDHFRYEDFVQFAKTLEVPEPAVRRRLLGLQEVAEATWHQLTALPWPKSKSVRIGFARDVLQGRWKMWKASLPKEK